MKQIKCYCGHTTYCDCGPLEDTKKIDMKYPIIFLSALIIEICSTFYVHYISESNAVGMVIFAFVGPFLGLPFAGYMVESKKWSERIKMAFALAFGYVAGALIVVNLIQK